ncbi:hypothetical protein V8C34DRAFT_325431 [Trichoderma compactum]
MRNFTPECTLPPNGTYSGYVHGVNARSTLEIVWSCIGIIILCTWSILHLDLPADVVFWMGLKLFSPEFAATGCARKIFATRSNSAMLEQLAHLDGVPWSLKHTILVDMGGIALRFLPTTKAEIGASTTQPQIKQRILKNRNGIPLFIQAFCERQSRLLKWCGQIPWDLWEYHVEHASTMETSPQGLARLESRAGSRAKSIFSEADVASLAGNIWILDSKQLAIARMRGIIAKMPNIKEEAIDDKSKSDGLVKIIAVIQVLWLVVQLVVRTIDNLHFTQLEITTVAFAATAVIIYSIDFIKPKDVNVPFYMEIKKVVECSWRKLYTLSPKSADIFSLLIGFASATSFGGVHLFAWNSDFPTDVERLLWRISALMTIVLPYIYIGTHIPHVGATVADIRQQRKTLMNIFLGCIAICYIPCRLFLVTESFRALYFLPSEAFMATPAVMSIPHLG